MSNKQQFLIGHNVQPGNNFRPLVTAGSANPVGRLTVSLHSDQLTMLIESQAHLVTSRERPFMTDISSGMVVYKYINTDKGRQSLNLGLPFLQSPTGTILALGSRLEQKLHHHDNRKLNRSHVAN